MIRALSIFGVKCLAFGYANRYRIDISLTSVLGTSQFVNCPELFFNYRCALYMSGFFILILFH